MKLWKRLVGLFFLLVILDGALRKWVFLPSASLAIFVVKDLVLWGGYLAYATYRNPFTLPRPLQSTWVPVLLGAYVCVVFLQAFNLGQPALTVSALGLKAHLGYAPLAVLMPALIAEATERQLIRYLWGYLVFVHIPIFLLAMYQFSQPPGAWVNQYVSDATTIAVIEGFPRITGTFPYIGSFTPYLQFSAFLSFSVLVAGIRWGRRQLQTLGMVTLASTLIVIPMTGSRSPVFIVGGGIIALLLVARFKGQWLGVLAMIALVGGLATAEFGDSRLLQGWGVWTERAQAGGTEAVERRTGSISMSPIDGIERAGLFGYGVGTNHQAATRVTAQTDWAGRYGGDRGALRVILELGALGWLVLVSLKVALLYIALRALRQSQRPWELIISATAFCVLLSHVLLPVVYNVVSGALYWGVAGAVLGVWSLQEARRRSVNAGGAAVR